MTAGLATLAVIKDEALVENAERTGRLLRDALTAMIERYDLLAEVRGRRLMVGLEFARPRSWRLTPSLTASWRTPSNYLASSGNQQSTGS